MVFSVWKMALKSGWPKWVTALSPVKSDRCWTFWNWRSHTYCGEEHAKKKWNKKSSNQSIGYFWQLISRAKLTAPPAHEILMANQVSNQPRWPEVKSNMALQSARLKFFNEFRQLGNIVLNAPQLFRNWAAAIVRFLHLSGGRYLTKKLRQSTELMISVLAKVKSPPIPTEHVLMN